MRGGHPGRHAFLWFFQAIFAQTWAKNVEKVKKKRLICKVFLGIIKLQQRLKNRVVFED